MKRFIAVMVAIFVAGTVYADTIHIVKRGDTLSAISRKYSISVSELKKINNLRSTKLKPGQKILVKQTERRAHTALSTPQETLLEPMVKLDELKELDPEVHTTVERLINFAKRLIGIPYRLGGNSLRGIDCSAFVQKVYGLIGIDLPRSARKQFLVGTPVEKEALLIGDLIFFRTYASFPSHVGIYLGNNLFIHASARAKKVKIDSLDTAYYSKRFIGAKRLIEVTDEKLKDS